MYLRNVDYRTSQEVRSLSVVCCELASFVTYSIKSGGEDLEGFITWCMPLLMSLSVWVCSLPFSLLSGNSVRSFCSVCSASLIATGSIMASYSTWCQQWHTSRDKSFQAFPPLFVLQTTKAGCGGLGTRLLWARVFV